MLNYSVTLLTTFNGGGRALSDCQRQALFLVATIVEHTGEDSNLTSTDLSSAAVPFSIQCAQLWLVWLESHQLAESCLLYSMHKIR